MKNKVVLGVAIIMLLSFGAWNGYGQKEKRETASFEYQVLTDPTQTTSMEEGLKGLNDLGAQGWELAGVSQGRNNAPTLYFKRVRK